MKKIFKKLPILMAAALLGTSCNDSFLDRQPTNDLNKNVCWRTLNDLEVFSNGIYNEAANNTGGYYFLLGFTNDPYSATTMGVVVQEAMSDNYASKQSTQTWAAAIAAGRETKPSGNPANYGGWRWTLLRRCNEFLANYEKVTAKTEEKNRYAGEALFFRAWFYLDKVQWYGDVPYITEPLETDSPELYGKRDPRKQVMDKVLEDIDLACNYLPASWPAAKPNRVTKGAALALKSRICIYEGTYRKYHNLGDYEKFLQEAVKAGEEAMKLGYEIYNTGKPEEDYATLFTSEDLGANKEIMLYRKYENGVFMHRQSGYIANIFAGGTKDFIDDYLCIDADGVARPVALSNSFKEDTPEQVFDNRDPRLSQTFLDPRDAATTLNGNNAKVSFPRLGDMSNWVSATGYHLRKYYSKVQDAKGFGNETSDAPIFRYAEVLLNYAEAKAELGTITKEDLDKSVNLLRRRAGMPDMELNPVMDPKYAGEGLSSLLVEIRRERRVELSFEQLRYHDLMRWKQGKKLAQRVLGMRFEDSEFTNPRYANDEGKILIYKPGTSGASKPVYTYEVNGRKYIDVYAGTEYAADKRSFDENKHYLHPVPTNVISMNPNLGPNNPGWD